MKLLPLAFAAFVCSAAAHESSSSRSGMQTFVAHKMDPEGDSNNVSESAKTNASPPESNSNKAPEKNTEANVDSPDKDVPGPTLERHPVEAQIKLSNVDMDELNPEEIMYFESSLRKAIQLAQEQEPDNHQDEVTIGAILVENGHGLHQNDNNNNRGLRGRETLSFSFFNIWAILETYRCRWCISYDDDDTDHYEEWKQNKDKYFPPPTPAPTPAPTPRPTYPVDDDAMVKYWEKLVKAYNGGGRRHLGVSESNTSLNGILCDLLREGPYERFHSVDECSLEVSKW